VFVIGSGRSGTTLLRRMLAQGGEIHIPSETYVLPQVIIKFAYLRWLPWRWLVPLVYADFQFRPEFAYFDMPLGPLVAHIKNAPPSRRSLAMMVDALFREHARLEGVGATRWGDKTPANTRHLPLIHAVFPDARYVHVVRDGCDVVASYLAAGLVASPLEAAERWSTMTRLARAFMAEHPGTTTEVRYEDLVHDPPERLRSVCGFLGLAYTPEMVIGTSAVSGTGDVPQLAHHAAVLEPVSAASVGKGRRVLDAATRSELQRAIGHQLEALGYPPCA